MFGDHKLPPKGIDCFMMTNDVNITITAAPCAEYKISVNVGNRQKYRHRHRLKSLTHYTLHITQSLGLIIRKMIHGMGMTIK